MTSVLDYKCSHSYSLFARDFSCFPHGLSFVSEPHAFISLTVSSACSQSLLEGWLVVTSFPPRTSRKTDLGRLSLAQGGCHATVEVATFTIRRSVPASGEIQSCEQAVKTERSVDCSRQQPPQRTTNSSHPQPRVPPHTRLSGSGRRLAIEAGWKTGGRSESTVFFEICYLESVYSHLSSAHRF
jgi:hypothetical protein